MLAARRAVHVGGAYSFSPDLVAALRSEETRRLVVAYNEAQFEFVRCKQALSEQLDVQRRREHEALERIASQEEFQSAVFWSSPDFLQQLRGRLSNGGISQSPAMLQAVLRYAARFTSKPTPFSRFARVVAVQFDSDGSDNNCQKYTAHLVGENDHINRIYMNRGFFDGFWRMIVDDAQMRERLSFRLNTSIIEDGDSFIFISHEGGRERLLRIHKAATLTRLLSLFGEAPATYKALRKEVVGALVGASEDQVDEYLVW